MVMTTSFKKSTFVNVVSSRKSNKNSLDIFWSFFFQLSTVEMKPWMEQKYLGRSLKTVNVQGKLKTEKECQGKKTAERMFVLDRKLWKVAKRNAAVEIKTFSETKKTQKKKNQIKRKRTICVQG